MSDESDKLRVESAQIEGLLSEIRELVPLPAWQRIEHVLRRVVALYAGGLSRTLAHGRDAGADPARLDELLASDELVSSLLALHGLHPHSAEERVRRALAECRVQLGVGDDDLVMTGIRDGVALVTTRVALGGSMSARVAEAAICRAIEAAAPELDRVELTGFVGRASEPALVQLRVRREAP
ncbi:MAG: hypothetical protein HOV81_33975 [Kofleriaceae bacterium]|nr:hypothetical protein [Kofleriaceae bacterium]